MASINDLIGNAKQTLLSQYKVSQTETGTPEGAYEPLRTIRPRYYEQLRRGSSRGTRASIQIIRYNDSFNAKSSNGQSRILRDRLLGNGGNPYADFLITGMSFGFQEKMSIMPVFGDQTVAYAFGAAPIVLQIQGILADDIDNDWFYKYIVVYRDYIRGTKLARNYELANLRMHNADFVGVVMSTNFSQDSQNDAMIQFSMQFLVREYYPYSSEQYDTDSLDPVPNLAIMMKDSSFSYAELRNNAKNALDLQVVADKLSAAGDALGISSDSCGGGLTTTNNSDSTAILNRTTGGIIGLGNFVKSLGNISTGESQKLSIFEKSIRSFGCSATGQTALTAIGKYSDAIDWSNKKVSSFGNLLGGIQRNLEVFNRTVGYLTNPLAELTSVVSNARNQAQRMTDLATMVKKSYQDLRNIDNIFGSLENELKGLERDFGNFKGSLASYNETSSDRLKNTLGSRSGPSANLSSTQNTLNGTTAVLPGTSSSSHVVVPPFLGSTRLGVTREQAFNNLQSSAPKSVVEKLNVIPTSPTYSTNADEQAVLNF